MPNIVTHTALLQIRTDAPMVRRLQGALFERRLYQGPFRMSQSPSRTEIRGTNAVAKAFFAAVHEVPEPHRPAVVKAAQAKIRDDLKAERDKAAVAKAMVAAKIKAAEQRAKAAAAKQTAAVKAPGKAKPPAAKPTTPAKRAHVVRIARRSEATGRPSGETSPAPAAPSPPESSAAHGVATEA